MQFMSSLIFLNKKQGLTTAFEEVSYDCIYISGICSNQYHRVSCLVQRRSIKRSGNKLAYEYGLVHLLSAVCNRVFSAVIYKMWR